MGDVHFVREVPKVVEPKKKPVNERKALPSLEKSNVHLVREGGEAPKKVEPKKPVKELRALSSRNESDVHFVRKEVPKEESKKEPVNPEHEPLPPWDLNRPKEINVTASRK